MLHKKRYTTPTSQSKKPPCCRSRVAARLHYNGNPCFLALAFRLLWLHGSYANESSQCHNSSMLRDMSLSRLLEEKSNYWRQGYVVVRGMFTPREMRVVKQVVTNSSAMNARVQSVRRMQRAGEHPSFSTIHVWNDVDGNDIFAKVGKSYKILDRLSCYFDDDVYDYHNKIALKYSGIAGFRPHQDHAYWRQFGAGKPDTSAVYIAIDEATLENGCLQVAERTHLLGTVRHGVWSRGAQRAGGDVGSDLGVHPKEWEALQQQGYALRPIPLKSGDAILFHGNTVHASDDNHSPNSRISMIATMNTRRNSPNPSQNAPGHPYWTHQARVFEQIRQKDYYLPLPNFAMKFPNTYTPPTSTVRASGKAQERGARHDRIAPVP